MLESFDELYKKYGPMVLRRCRFILQDEDKALDAMQDTFVRIFERKEYLQEVCASFFYTAATRVCLNRIRSDKVRYASRLDDILQGVADSRSEAGAETQFEERITSSAFLDFLFSSENEKTKEMAVLHYVDGFTLEETAEKTHFSVSGVRKRLRNLQKRAAESIRSWIAFFLIGSFLWQIQI